MMCHVIVLIHLLNLNFLFLKFTNVLIGIKHCQNIISFIKCMFKFDLNSTKNNNIFI